MEWTVGIIIGIVILVILSSIFYMEKMTYEDSLKSIKVGGCYRLHQDYDNPFAPYVIVKEIRYNQFKEPFVKYELSDGTQNFARFTDFIDSYNVFMDVKKGES